MFALGMAGKTIKRIEIHSSWVGFNSREKAELVIRDENGRFTLDGKTIEPALVNAFADALAEPAVPEPDSRNLGLTVAWLRDHARSAALKRAAKETDVVPLGGYWSQSTPKQKEFFIKSLGDPAIVQAALRSVFADGDGDLYSEAMVRADITFDDGSKSSVESTSRFEFMLPWKLSPSGPDSYNAKISRALAALMPEGTVNQALLAGKDLDGDFEVKLAEAVMQEVINDWNILATEDKVGATLARIRKAEYKIVRAELGDSVGEETRMLTREEVLDVLIRKAVFPPNLFYELALFDNRGQVEGLDYFFRSSSRLETSVLSVPWLKTFIQQHQEVPFRIFYTDTFSLSNAAIHLFAADMHAAGKDQLAREVKRQQSSAILLMVGSRLRMSYWILLPDKRVILWKYAPFGHAALLKWTPDSFPSFNCRTGNGSICAGAMISSDGALLKPDRDPREIETTCLAAWRHQHAAGATPAEALFPVRSGGKSGAMDRKGNVVIPLCFDYVGEFHEGLARFERARHWGFLDATGKAVIPPRFTSAAGASYLWG